MIYSITDMAGDVGGFGHFLYVTCLISVGGYANRMLLASLIQDMFRVRLATGKTRLSFLMKRGSTILHSPPLSMKKKKEELEGGESESDYSESPQVGTTRNLVTSASK